MHRYPLIPPAAVLACSLLSGCNTDDELLKQKLDVLVAEEKALEGVKETLRDINDLEGQGSVSLFLSAELINSVLAGADNVVVPVPGVKGATVQVRSMRAGFRAGMPIVNIDAVAAKEGLGATLELVGVAMIETSVVEGVPQLLEMKVHLDSLVPRAKWGVFDLGLGGFVRDLMKVKLSDELRQIGAISIPIETDIPLSIPARDTPVTFQGVRGLVATPELSITGKAKITRVLPLPDGLHIYGTMSANGGAAL